MSDRMPRAKKKSTSSTPSKSATPLSKDFDVVTSGATATSPSGKRSKRTAKKTAASPISSTSSSSSPSASPAKSPEPAIEWREIEVSVASLIPYERNPRTITEAAHNELKRRIIEDGYHQRVLATHDVKIIGGHQRKKIFEELGWTHVKVLVPNRALTKTEFRRLLVRDNLPHLGTFDMGMVAADFEIKELLDWGMPPKWMDLMPSTAADEDSEAAELQPSFNNTVSAPGDVWLCGDHRIMCGDSTAADDVAKLLNALAPNLMVTDPPYGVEYDAGWRNKVVRANGTKVAARAVGKVSNDDRADWSQAWSLFPGNIVYVWHGMLFSGLVAATLEDCGFKIRAEIVWAKNQPVIGRGDYHAQHESCWYAVKEKGNWHGDRSQSTLWQIDKPSKSKTGHSTQKPIECMRKPMENNSAPGEYVYDPFLGSGTTLIAASQIGRFCLGMEIEPGYVDLAVKRWENETGKKAVLEENGDTFESAMKARLG